jgi:hypothetical protein
VIFFLLRYEIDQGELYTFFFVIIYARCVFFRVQHIHGVFFPDPCSVCQLNFSKWTDSPYYAADKLKLLSWSSVPLPDHCAIGVLPSGLLTELERVVGPAANVVVEEPRIEGGGGMWEKGQRGRREGRGREKEARRRREGKEK